MNDDLKREVIKLLSRHAFFTGRLAHRFTSELFAQMFAVTGVVLVVALNASVSSKAGVGLGLGAGWCAFMQWRCIADGSPEPSRYVLGMGWLSCLAWIASACAYLAG